jgi:hypothetical protein
MHYRCREYIPQLKEAMTLLRSMLLLSMEVSSI